MYELAENKNRCGMNIAIKFSGKTALFTGASQAIGGQMLCLLLSLLVTPVSYPIFDDWGDGRFFRRKARRQDLRQPETAKPAFY